GYVTLHHNIYDLNGRLLQAIDDTTGNYVEYTYTAAGDIASEKTYDGTSSDPVDVKLYTYDTLGRVLTTTDGLGNIIKDEYDAAGNKTAETVAYGTPAAARTEFTFDTNGWLTKIKDPGGHETTFGYNAAGQQISMTDPNGHSVLKTYDSDGTLKSVTDRNGRKIEYSRDALGRVTGETWYAADGVTVVETLSYSFNVMGELTGASSSVGSYGFTYDAAGRVKHVDEPVGVSLDFTYDQAGNRTRLVDSLGYEENSVYGADHELVRRTLHPTSAGTGQGELRIDQVFLGGRLTDQTRSSDIAGTSLVGTSHYDYDAAGRAKTLTHDKGAANIAGYTFTYNAAGQLYEQTDHGVTRTFGYDEQGQLTSETGGSTSHTYTYDDAGTRASIDSTNYTPGDDNQIDSDGTWNYSYDNEGNMTGKEDPVTGEKWTYGYDHHNELIKVEHQATATDPVDLRVEFKYDALGNRVEKSVDLDGDGSGAAEVL